MNGVFLINLLYSFQFARINTFRQDLYTIYIDRYHVNKVLFLFLNFDQIFHNIRIQVIMNEMSRNVENILKIILKMELLIAHSYLTQFGFLYMNFFLNLTK